MLLKTKALTTALLTGLCVSAMAVAGQPTPAVGQPDTTATPEGTAAGKRAAEEEITVTGSRIRRKDLTTPAPVTIISREQVVASGRVSIGDFLQTLPEQGNAINTSVNNGGDGATRINLRGLGSVRTLVLVNGRRLMPGGTGADQSADLNSIPSAAVERIEVLKDGASALYGSDAVAGVVNIITRKNFRATEINAQSGITSRGDGTTYDLNVTTGTGGDRGNVTFSAGYFNQVPVWAGTRDFSKVPRAYDSTGDTNPFGQIGEYSAGSGTIPQGRLRLSKSEAGKPITGASSLYNGLVAAHPKDRNFIKCTNAEIAKGTSLDGACGQFGWRVFIPFVVAGQGGDAYNFQPENYLVTPQQRISLYSAGDTRLGSFARAFFEASYVNRQSSQKLAPEPLVIGPPGGELVTISRDNIYNPFLRPITLFNRRLVEASNRNFTQDIDNFRVVGGLDGTLPEDFGPLRGWFWEASLNYGRVAATSQKRGNINLPHLQNAIGPTGNDSNGNLVCIKDKAQPVSGTNIISNCVPLNLFGGQDPAGQITQDQLTGLTFTGVERGINQLTSAQFNTSGELFPLLGDRPLGLALGYEFRNVQGQDVPDPLTVGNEASGNKSSITGGGYYVNEGYAELSIPIMSNQPYVQNLEATAAARVFHYNTFGTDWTYKLGARYTPIRDFTVRGTYSTAFRAPSVPDLFLGRADNFPSVRDPCSGNAGTPPPNCGSAAGNGDTSTQLRSSVGGSLNNTVLPQILQPETARVWTVGLVFEPTMIRNLSVTVDYYNIRVFQRIDSIGESIILAGCYPQSGGATSFCSLISRDPTTGFINNIQNFQTNVGTDKTDGIDLAVRYALPTEYGRFGFVFDGTWLHKFDRTLADGFTVRGRGSWDLGQSGAFGGTYPAFKANTQVTWNLGGLGVGGIARFVGSFHECDDPTSPGDFSGSGLCSRRQDDPAPMSRLVPAYVSFDVFASYTLRTPVGRTTLAAGMNNVGDHTPPVIYNNGFSFSDPSAYDYMGRFVYGRISHTF